MEARIFIKSGFWRVGTVVVAAVIWGCGGGGPPDQICPEPGDSSALETVIASHGNVRYSTPPDVSAKAHGQSVALRQGESEWCGIVSDVFHVVTNDTPLLVAPGEEITVPNPLPQAHLYDAGIDVEAATANPTPEAGGLIWPFGPGSDRSCSATTSTRRS